MKDSAARTEESGTALEVLRAFLKLGVTSFGGPIAVVGFTLLAAWRAAALLVVLWCVLASIVGAALL